MVVVIALLVVTLTRLLPGPHASKGHDFKQGSWGSSGGENSGDLLGARHGMVMSGSSAEALSDSSVGVYPSSGLTYELTLFALLPETGALVGTGSFGRVYKGMWNGQQVAIKVMEVGLEDKYVANEIAINKMIAHPNLVRCLHTEYRPMYGASRTGEGEAAGEDEASWTQVLIVMEYLNAGTLAQAIRARRLMQATMDAPNMLLVTRLALDIARAMACMHSHNVLHGDLASKNVLLSTNASSSSSDCGLNSASASCSSKSQAQCAGGASGSAPGLAAKVADFGLSRIVPHDMSHLSTLSTGTLTHQAPELLQGRRLTSKCDVYSYGIVLWEMVHPQSRSVYPPELTHGTPWAIVQHVVDGRRPDFTQPQVPAAYKELVCRCWNANPEKRPSFEEIVSTLSGDSSGDSYIQDF